MSTARWRSAGARAGVALALVALVAPTPGEPAAIGASSSRSPAAEPVVARHREPDRRAAASASGPTSTTVRPTTTSAAIGRARSAPPSAPASPTTTVAPRAPVAAPAAAGRWVPRVGATWQWQLTGPVDMSVDAEVYDVDGFDVSAATVAELHAAGRRVVCYLSVGAWESWRPDQAAFPESVLGSANGWPGERWLDIRRLDVLAPILGARLDMCRDKGFDAVEPDNIDGYANSSGFPLTAADQLTFNTWVATAAHARGMSVALKNDLDQVAQLVDHFDFAVNEQCFQYDECAVLQPFLDRGKAVLHVEYHRTTAQFCSTVPAGFSSMRKREDLDAWREVCPS